MFLAEYSGVGCEGLGCADCSGCGDNEEGLSGTSRQNTRDILKVRFIIKVVGQNKMTPSEGGKKIFTISAKNKSITKELINKKLNAALKSNKISRKKALNLKKVYNSGVAIQGKSAGIVVRGKIVGGGTAVRKIKARLSTNRWKKLSRTAQLLFEKSENGTHYVTFTKQGKTVANNWVKFKPKRKKAVSRRTRSKRKRSKIRSFRRTSRRDIRRSRTPRTKPRRKILKKAAMPSPSRSVKRNWFSKSGVTTPKAARLTSPASNKRSLTSIWRSKSSILAGQKRASQRVQRAKIIAARQNVNRAQSNYKAISRYADKNPNIDNLDIKREAGKDLNKAKQTYRNVSIIEPEGNLPSPVQRKITNPMTPITSVTEFTEDQTVQIPPPQAKPASRFKSIGILAAGLGAITFFLLKRKKKNV